MADNSEDAGPMYSIINNSSIVVAMALMCHCELVECCGAKSVAFAGAQEHGCKDNAPLTHAPAALSVGQSIQPPSVQGKSLAALSARQISCCPQCGTEYSAALSAGQTSCCPQCGANLLPALSAGQSIW